MFLKNNLLNTWMQYIEMMFPLKFIEVAGLDIRSLLF